MSEPEYVRSAETVEVIQVVALRGEGRAPDSPYRAVTAYYLPDGTFIGEHDTWSDVVSPCEQVGHEWGTMWQGDEPWMRCLRCASPPEGEGVSS